jgi:hypothetical protein
VKRVAVVLLVVAMSPVGCGGDDNANESADPTESAKTETAEQSGPEPEPEPRPKTPRQRLKDALQGEIDAGGYVGKLDIKKVEISSREAAVTVETPEGGFEGASCDDLNDGAGAVFQRIYGEADWKRDAVVVFEGRLVNKETGRDLPNANTGIFTVHGRDARRIDWSDEDAVQFNIDWSVYRDFCHPALKQ